MDANVAEILARHWGVVGAEVRSLGGGMNSETWSVRHKGRSFVAKMVAQTELDQFRSGCEIAADLANAGLVTGRPVPSVDGRLLIHSPPLALLEFVSGRELDGQTGDEQRWIAQTLARVHQLGDPRPEVDVSDFFPWLNVEAPGVDALPWLQSAITTVRDQTDPLHLTWSILHTDPAPEAFRHDDMHGVTGLIDWTGAQRGPILYDLASAVMYLGGPNTAATFLDIYRTSGPLGHDELQHLYTLRKFRWVVQAVYFAGRLNAHDLTGVSDQSDNERGLTDAREGLASLGVSVV